MPGVLPAVGDDAFGGRRPAQGKTGSRGAAEQRESHQAYELEIIGFLLWNQEEIGVVDGQIVDAEFTGGLGQRACLARPLLFEQ